MIADTLSRPVRRFLVNRLERLHETLENLSQRLRESIAQVIGTQVGEAIQDALEAAMLSVPRTFRQDRRQFDHHPRDHPAYHSGYPDDRNHDGDFWGEPDAMDSEPEELPKPSRWRPLLAGLVQLGAWCLKSKRPSLKQVLGVLAAVGVASIVAGPLAGGMVMALGSAVLMTQIADATSSAAEMLARLPAE